MNDKTSNVYINKKKKEKPILTIFMSLSTTNVWQIINKHTLT